MSRTAIREVAGRELRTRARTKAFRVITLIMLLAAVSAPLVLTLLQSGSDDAPRQVTIGIGEGVPEQVSEQIQLLGSTTISAQFIELGPDSSDQVEALLTTGDLDVAIEMPPTLAWSEDADLELAGLLTAALRQTSAIERGQAAGLDLNEVGELLTPISVEQRFVGGSDTSDELRAAVAFVGLFTAFVLPQVFGQLTMLSVVEEKSTRVIEVLLSHIRPRTLLAGKLLGLGVLALVQLGLIIVGVVASLLATNTVDVPRSIWQFVPILLVSVVGGLAIYTTLFALLGSLISRQEDASQVMLPVFVPLMAGYLVGQSAIWGDADSALTRAFTWLPLTAPMLLPVRVARQAISPVEVAASLALLALGVWLLVRLAGRVYEFTLLRTGSRVGWRELIRLSRGTLHA